MRSLWLLLVVLVLVVGLSPSPSIAGVIPGSLLASFTDGFITPTGVAVDPSGDVYVADGPNNRIVVLSSTGATMMVLNNSNSFNYPTAVAVANGMIYVCDSYNNRVVVLYSLGNQFLSITDGLVFPGGVAVNSLGSIFVTDGGNNRVVVFSSQGKQQQSFTAGFSNPRGIALDNAGNIYVADTSNNRVVVLSSSGAPLHTFTDGFQAPYGVEVDAFGRIYIGDSINNRLVILSPAGTQRISLSNGYSWLTGVALDSSLNVYMADASNNRIVKVAPPCAAYYSGTEVGSYLSDQIEPLGVAVDASGKIYATDAANERVVVMSSTGTLLYSYAPGLNNPKQLTVDGSGNIYVADLYNKRVVKLGPKGNILANFTDGFNLPGSVAVDGSGNVYISDEGSNKVVKFSSSGVPLKVYTDSFDTPAGIAVDASGNLYVCDVWNYRVVVLNPAGTQLYTLTGFQHPTGVALDAAGNIYVVDQQAQNVQVFSTANGGSLLGTYTDSNGFFNPAAVAVDAAGNIYVADCMNYRVAVLVGLNSCPSSSSSTSPPSSSPRHSSSSTAASSSPHVSSSSSPTSSPVVPTSAPAPTSAKGSLCFLFYSLPGTVDYPWSVAYSLTVTYQLPLLSSAAIFTAGSGTRTYTNRFGTTLTTPVTVQTNGPMPVGIYLNNPYNPIMPLGLGLSLSAPVQQPGNNPQSAVSGFLLLGQGVNSIYELGSYLQDPAGQAVVSNIPGFVNVTIVASNINSLAANYEQCTAPLTFTNGLRSPTQPSVSNSAAHFSYGYSISDGSTYSVQTSLLITTTSAFATTHDQLGNPYQTVINITGSRTYSYLPTGATLTSQVVGLANTSYPQRFYPYALLSAAPNVYGVNTAPFLDANGLSFRIAGSVPITGDSFAGGVWTSVIAVQISKPTSATASSVVLAESPIATNAPLASLQTQSYSLTA